MKDVAILLNGMVSEGIIRSYAVFGAVAQMRYTEAVSTMDADILVSIDPSDPLTVLSPLYAYCRKQGYQPEGEAIRVGDWPVQFIPTFDALTTEAVEYAETADMEGEAFRVVRADYLAVIAIRTGRAKDHLRVVALLEAGATNPDEISKLAEKHGLAEEWSNFRKRYP